MTSRHVLPYHPLVNHYWREVGRAMTSRHVLPFPPSVNRYWRHVAIGRSVRAITSEAGRKYRKEVVALLDGAVKYTDKPRLAITMWVYPPDRRRRDLDNMPKAVLDAIEAAGVVVDDSQFDELHVVRCGVVDGGRVVVEIKKLTYEEDE